MGTVSVADALFSKVRQRVLAVLFGNPSRSFHARELIALAGSGSGAVQRELARLEGARLVTATRVGHQRHYQADPTSPVYAELRGLVLKTAGLADVLRGALAPIADQIGAAFVFGSVARGEDTAKSDVDLLVVSETLAYADLYDRLATAEDRLARRISPTLYTAVDLRGRLAVRNAFVTKVLAGPKIWIIGSDDDLPPR